jgi:uncharacterized membrane protein
MWDLLSHPVVRAVLVVVVVLVVAYVCFQILFALRPKTSKDDINPTEMELDLEEMRSGGDISEQELRNIKAVLGRNQHNS